MEQKGEFSAHLWQQPPEAYQGKVPFIVSDLISELKKLKAENVQGIFRLNGSDKQIKLLIEELDKSRITDWKKYENVHTIATALKRYFRAMASFEPVIPFRLYNECIAIGKKYGDSAEAKDAIREVVKKLDIGRYNTLSYLIKYLKYISQFSDENLMVPKNIAVCFGPNIIASDRPDSSDAFSDSLIVVNVLTVMITYYEEIFDNHETVENFLCNDEDIAALTIPPLEWTHVANLMARSKDRCIYKGIPYVPSANMQMGLGISRPKRHPPPTLADFADTLAKIRNGFADFYGDAVGAQNIKALEEEIELPKTMDLAPAEESKLGFDSVITTPVEAVPIEEEKPVVKYVLTKEELFIPPEETVIIRKGGQKGRRPPRRK